jgi:Predicted integral membrane protein
MNTYRTRAQLKGEVKNLLSGRWKSAIALYIIPLILAVVTNGYGNSNSGVHFEYDISNFDIARISRYAASSGIISFILSAIFLIITLSASFRGLDWLEDPDLTFDPWKSNFTYFRSPDWWQLIFIYVIIGIFTFLWALLLVIPGIIKSIAYSQTYFVYKDYNDRGLADNYSLTDYITRSRKLMVGNKWRYFVLQLSFIGWWILGCITIGIGFIWIYPYYKLTMANFYRDLVANEK